ncbi:MAG TPA: TonB-dependent receptor [Caulobacteraceae bacterium]|nr:TonB-dependent receptor [Caulobacteraceae bacterium]
MKTQTARQRLLASTIIGGAALMAITATPAFAQEESTEVEAVVVTGSRIVRQDFEAISPVTTVGSEQLELTATLTVDTLLNELPQIVPGNTRTSNNAGGEEFATIDLRGLGTNRTLVLVNGERVPGSSTTGVVDLNTIPASLIDRVEVVTGGASAVYGSDAISGVVNFILKDDYEGAELTATYGSSFDGHAPEFEINGLLGGNFANGRGNITAYAAYYNRDKVSQSEFEFSRVSAAACYDGGNLYVCDTAAEAADSIANGGFVAFAGGSGTPSWGWIANNGSHTAGADGIFGTADDVITGNPFNPALINANPLTSGQFASYDHDCNPATPNIFYGQAAGLPSANGNASTRLQLSFNDAGALEPRNQFGACGVPDRAAGSSRYNFAPDNYLIIPAERFNLTTTATYDITDTLRAKVMLSFVNSTQEVQLAPTPAVGLSVTLTPATMALISASAPDLAAALASRPNPTANFNIDRRFNEVGTRNGFSENNSFYLLTTLDGQFNDNWNWSLTGSYGSNRFDSRGINSVNETALLQGLAGCQTPAGAPLGSQALPGCVPIDIYGPGTLTDDMVDFLRVSTFAETQVEESRIAGFVRGDLFELPAGPVAAVFGFEYRETAIDFRVDNEQRTGNIFGFNAIQDVSGAIDVTELYTEVSVPLVKDAPFAQYLGLEGGYRLSDYSSVGEVETFKIGGEWAPVDWLRFRAVYNEATRAPSALELFQNGDQGFPSYTDPCNNATGAVLAFCNAQNPGYAPGYATFFQNNSQVEAFAFGNPNLKPETAETWTAGVVFQPDWFPVGTFRATADYYNIEITDAVSTLGAGFFLNDCYINQDMTSCARIVRDPVTGEVDSVDTTITNLGVISTEGWDFQAEWTVNLEDTFLPIPGRLRVNELLSIVDNYMIDGVDYVGYTFASIGGAFFDWKSTLSVYYSLGDWTAFARWSYVPELTGISFGIPDPQPEASYVDASVRWNVTDNFQLTGFIGNIFDEEAPQTTEGLFSQANTDPQVYRVLGRTFSISAKLRF